MAYGSWSSKGLEASSLICKDIQRDRTKHGDEFDKVFKEVMKLEAESEKKSKKRKKDGMDVYNDLNKEKGKPEEGSYSSNEEPWVATNQIQI
jgi:rubrerythrin